MIMSDVTAKTRRVGHVFRNSVGVSSLNIPGGLIDVPGDRSGRQNTNRRPNGQVSAVMTGTQAGQPKKRGSMNSCIECGSSHLVDDGHGFFVCRDCGVVAEWSQQLQCETIYDSDDGRHLGTSFPVLGGFGTTISRPKNKASNIEINRIAKRQRWENSNA